MAGSRSKRLRPKKIASDVRRPAHSALLGGGISASQVAGVGATLCGAVAAVDFKANWQLFSFLWATGVAALSWGAGHLHAPKSIRALLAAIVLVASTAVWLQKRPQAEIQIDRFVVHWSDGSPYGVSVYYKNVGAAPAEGLRTSANYIVQVEGQVDMSEEFMRTLGRGVLAASEARARGMQDTDLILAPSISSFNTVLINKSVGADAADVRDLIREGRARAVVAGVVQYRDWWPVERKVTFCVRSMGLGAVASCRIGADY